MNFDTHRYGMFPFWFWNGKQSEAEITRQLEMAARGGVQGMAIHARKGNQVEYMSERWMNLFRHACLEARRLDLEIWLYDEEGCPSGTVGERLPAQGEKYQQQALTFAYMTAEQVCSKDNYIRGFRSENVAKVLENDIFHGELIRAFRANDLSTPVNPAKLPGNTAILVFSRIFITDYINVLERDTLEAFLNMTHSIYKQKLGEFFGNPITAVYTDDLNHLLIYGDDIPFLSYTDSLEDFFCSKYNYSILDNLPALVENLPGCEKIRIDYRNTIMRMFLDNYVEPMRQWCQRHGLPLTGHLSGDEGSMLKSVCRFTSAMPFYEHEDIPGIDDFLACRQDNAYLRHPFNELGFSAIILCKQVSSVASQLKNGKCSSEVLTSRGWGVPVSQQMTQIRFQQGLGINILIPHDFSYSTAGETKRDHPASYFFQQPWFQENKELQAGVARSSQLLGRGLCAAKVAVLNPVTSGWIALDGEKLTRRFKCQHSGKFADTKFLEKNFAELSLNLLRHHIDFEYLDEELLERHGTTKRGLLFMGASIYETVILPPINNIQSSTLNLLYEFATGGGKVVATNMLPTLVDGLMQENIFNFSVITSSVAKPDCGIQPLLQIITSDGDSSEILLHTRMVEKQPEYFLVNLASCKKELNISNIPAGHVLFDPLNNRIITANNKFPEQFTLSSLACCHILPESILDVAHEDINISLFAPQASFTQMDIKIKSTVIPENDNILLIDAGFLSDGSRILFSDTANLPSGLRLVVPISIPEPELVDGLYMETNQRTGISINGHPPIWLDERHLASQDLQKASLNNMLNHGKNEFILTTSGKRIENFYLTGNFGVKLINDPDNCRAELTEPPRLGLGDVSQQGMPFYWGVLRYELSFFLDKISGKCFIDLGEVKGVVRVKINGKDAGIRYFAPWSFGLKGMIKAGENHIEVTLYNTAQNLFGPHRAKNIFGSIRTREGSSNVAWTPELAEEFLDSWGVASFGLYGPITLM